MLFLMRKYKHYAISFIYLLYDKKIIIKKNCFILISYYFTYVSCYFAGVNWEKPILRRHFLCPRKLPFFWRKLRKAYFASAFSCRGKKNLNCKGCSSLVFEKKVVLKLTKFFISTVKYICIKLLTFSESPVKSQVRLNVTSAVI